MNNEERLFDKLYNLTYYSNSINYCAIGKLLNNLNIDCVLEADCKECSAEHLREEYNSVRKFE